MYIYRIRAVRAGILGGDMARIRTVKPEFLRHEELQELESEHLGKYPMFVFMGLWSACDKQGVFPWKPKLLKLDIYPFLGYDMGETLGILLDSGFVEKFETANGKSWGFVPNFEKHQRITGDEGKNPSRYPSPHEAVAQQSRHTGDTSATQPRRMDENGKRKGIKEKEGERNSSGSSEPPSPATISDLETVQSPDETPPDEKTGKPEKPSLREREPKNDQERVLKAYGLNWDRLYAEGKVKDPKPPENWGLARRRLKQCLERLPAERIIEAIDRGLHDDKAMEGGYSLSGMLVDWLFNRLLNGSTGPPSGHGNSPPPSLAGKRSLGAILRSSGDGGYPPRDDLDESHGERGFA